MPGHIQYHGPDHLTFDNARALAERIQSYWHARGAMHVRAFIEPIDGVANIVGYAVRSNLIGGEPPRAA